MTRAAFDDLHLKIAAARDDKALHDVLDLIVQSHSLEGYERMNLWDAAARKNEEISRLMLADVPAVPPPASPSRAAGIELAEATAGLPTPAAAKAMWDRYKGVLDALVLPEDLVEISGRKYRKKSYWRRVAAAFGIRLEALSSSSELLEREDRVGWVARAVVRASLPSGRHADGIASCSTWERKEDRKEHDVYATAYTRAANRAIADLVAAGEVSAEEVE